MTVLKWLLFFLAFLGGIAIGHLIDDFPLVKFNREIKIYEVLTLILTASIGLLIPFFIKRWIEDSRYIKNNIVADLRELLEDVTCIKATVKSSFHSGSLYQKDKDYIIVQFEEVDLRVSSIELLINEFKPGEGRKIISHSMNEYLCYWKLLTGSEIMSNNFNSIPQSFYKSQNEAFNRFETEIKRVINRVNRF